MLSSVVSGAFKLVGNHLQDIFRFCNNTQHCLNRNCLFFLPTSPAIPMLLLFLWLWPLWDFMSVTSNSICFLRLTYFLSAVPSRLLRAMAGIRITFLSGLNNIPNMYAFKCPFKYTPFFSLENMITHFMPAGGKNARKLLLPPKELAREDLKSHS